MHQRTLSGWNVNTTEDFALPLMLVSRFFGVTTVTVSFGSGLVTSGRDTHIPNGFAVMRSAAGNTFLANGANI